jgi:hypothetical protein
MGDCSDGGEEVGVCEEIYPMSQCDCNEKNHYGGDECEIKYCLNDCGDFGKCEDGVCECEDAYYGEDCTVYTFDVSFVDDSGDGAAPLEEPAADPAATDATATDATADTTTTGGA